MIRPNPKLSPHTCVFIALFVTAMVSAGIIIQHSTSSRWQQQQRSNVLAHLAAPLLHQLQLRKDPQQTFRHWAEIITQHPDIARIAIINTYDQVELSWPEPSAEYQWYQHPEQLAPFELLRLPVNFEIGATCAREVVFVAQADSALFSPTAATVPLWPLVLVALLLLVLLDRRLGRESERLLRRFVHRARHTLGESAPAYSHKPIDIELNMLLDNIDALRKDAVGWHQETHKLQQIIDSKVKAETRYVNTLLKRMEKQAGTDPLTGVLNRSGLSGKAVQLFERHHRLGIELGLIMIDIDHFKQLNDTLGHQAGDALLQFVGELIRTHMKPHDLPIRYGGDEFLLVLPNQTSDGAMLLGQRLAALFRQYSQALRVDPKPTMSIGIATLSKHRPQSLQGLINAADEALYEVKNGGKGYVHIAGRNRTALAG